MHPICIPFERLLISGMILMQALTLSVFEPEQKPPENREQIGTVLGKPVYRDQIKKGNRAAQSDQLLRLFVRPVLLKYRLIHRNELEPTQEELDFTAEHFDKLHEEELREKRPQLEKKLAEIQLKLRDNGLTEEQRSRLLDDWEIVQMDLQPKGRFMARFLLSNWKLQRHLYDNFGGGRILWQQAGLEAFDAMHNWLKAHEEKGEFKVTDPELHELLYEYWNDDHIPFVTSDKGRIRTEFLEPEWAPKRVKKDGIP
jgi:hypothetical protein